MNLYCPRVFFDVGEILYYSTSSRDALMGFTEMGAGKVVLVLWALLKIH